jgi:hypothetical protein
MLPQAIGAVFLPNEFNEFITIFGLFLVVFVGAVVAASKKDTHQKVLLFTSIIYITALLYSEYRTQVDSINARLLSPIAPILLLLFLYSLQRVVVPGFNILFRSISYAGLSLLLVANGLHLLVILNQPSLTSVGLIGTLDKTIKRKALVPSETPIFSTNPWRTYLETGLQPVYYFPTTLNYYNPADKVIKDKMRLAKSLTGNKTALFFCYEEVSTCRKFAESQKLFSILSPQRFSNDFQGNSFRIGRFPFQNEESVSN